MTEQLIGLVLLGIGVVAIAAAVAAAARSGDRPSLHPPRGIHVPPGSWLPMLWATGGALLAAGLAFKPDDQAFAWWFLIPGLVVIVAAAVMSIRAAGREWHETEQGSHDEDAGHH
jgi:hypothetical protein